MANKTVYLVKYRQTASQRAHFAIYVPESTLPGDGIKIHVFGAPMAGFSLEINEKYSLADEALRHTVHRLGEVSASSLAAMQQLAHNVRPPGISPNFMAPVDGIHNRRCQEWATEYVQLLVDRGILDSSARDIIQNERDPPSFGIGLSPAGRGQGQGH